MRVTVNVITGDMNLPVICSTVPHMHRRNYHIHDRQIHITSDDISSNPHYVQETVCAYLCIYMSTLIISNYSLK